MRWMTVCLVVSLGLSAAAMAQQTGTTKMYKWTDENGTVHYSAKPEEQVQAQEVEIRKGPAAGPATAVVPQTDPLEAARCAKIRESVRNLQSPSLDLEVQADDGSTRPMTDEEREPLLAQYLAAQEACDKAVQPVPPE